MDKKNIKDELWNLYNSAVDSDEDSYKLRLGLDILMQIFWVTAQEKSKRPEKPPK